MNKLKKYMVFVLAVVFMVSFSGCSFGKNKTSQTKGDEKIEGKTSTNSGTSQKNTTSNGKENMGDKTQQGQSNKSANSAGTSSKQSTTGSSKGTSNNGPTLSSVKKSEGVYVSAKKANFGSLVNVYINDKNIDRTKIGFFQIILKDKPISKVSQISENTTIYPDQKRGTKVKIKFFDKSQKLIKTVDAVVVEDK